ncbi:MAG: PqqD family protein [Janthinobacterium lividum]
MKLKKNIATSEAGFVFNPATGDSFAASPLAAEVLDLLKAGQLPAAIQQHLLERYEVSPSQLQRDLDDFLAQLRLFQLLEAVG